MWQAHPTRTGTTPAHGGNTPPSRGGQGTVPQRRLVRHLPPGFQSKWASESVPLLPNVAATLPVPSFMHGWLDFGVGNSTTPQVVVTCGNDNGIRPIMKVNSNTCPANQITFENWYDNNGGAWGWTLDSTSTPTIGRVETLRILPPGSAIGGIKNLTRRIEFAWYPERSSQRGEFWADQFGGVMSGPNDARCGTQQARGDALIHCGLPQAVHRTQPHGDSIPR